MVGTFCNDSLTLFAIHFQDINILSFNPALKKMRVTKEIMIISFICSSLTRLNFNVSSPVLGRKKGDWMHRYYTDSIFGNEREGDTNIWKLCLHLFISCHFQSIIKRKKGEREREKKESRKGRKVAGTWIHKWKKEDNNVQSFFSLSPFYIFFIIIRNRIRERIAIDLDIIFIDNKCSYHYVTGSN